MAGSVTAAAMMMGLICQGRAVAAPVVMESILSLGNGWNLCSLTVQPENNVVDTLLAGMAQPATSVWKWQANNWVVYMPSQGDKGAAYAQSKGFTLMSTLDTGEGFWVNNTVASQLSVSGIPASGPLALVKGWNLIGLKNSQAVEVAGLMAGKEAQFASLFAWDNQQATWNVYLPGEVDHGAAYAASKGFGLFTVAHPGEGFWVNAQSDASEMSDGATTTTTAGTTTTTVSLTSTTTTTIPYAGAGPLNDTGLTWYGDA